MSVRHQPDVYSATAPDGWTETRTANRTQRYAYAVAILRPAGPDREETLISTVTGQPFTVITKGRATDSWRLECFSRDLARAEAEVRRLAKKGHHAVVVDATATFLCACDRCAAIRTA